MTLNYKVTMTPRLAVPGLLVLRLPRGGEPETGGDLDQEPSSAPPKPPALVNYSTVSRLVASKKMLKRG